jgi:hypothetical protein
LASCFTATPVERVCFDANGRGRVRASDGDEFERKRKEHDAAGLVAGGFPHPARNGIQLDF